jgi:glycerol uptake facilitator-like aquaporin
MLQIGRYTTLNGKEVRIYFPIRDTLFDTLGWVKGVGIVAYTANGNVAYDHIPPELSLDMASWQSMPERKG